MAMPDPSQRCLHPDCALTFVCPSAVQVIVLKAPNPFGDYRGVIPAILFRYTNEDLASAFYADPPLVPEPYAWAVCGNLNYALPYLLPARADISPPPTPVSLKVRNMLSIPK